MRKPGDPSTGSRQVEYLAAHKDGALRLTVYIQPRASSTRIIGLHGGPHGEAVKIGITAPPVDGRANGAVIEFLADFFRIPKSAVTIKAGLQGRTKQVTLTGISLAEASRLLAAAVGKDT